MSDLRPGDTVRILDTDYTRTQGDHVAACRGELGEITDVHTYVGMGDVLGFDAIYDVRVGPFDLSLIADDVALVARPARIT